MGKWASMSPPPPPTKQFGRELVIVCTCWTETLGSHSWPSTSDLHAPLRCSISMSLTDLCHQVGFRPFRPSALPPTACARWPWVMDAKP